MQRIIASLLLLLASTSLHGDPASARVRLAEGLPEFKPLVARYQDGFHVAISPSSTFVWIDEERNGQEIFYLLRKTPGGWSLSEISLERDGDDLVGEFVSPNERGVEEVLEFRLDPAERVLSHRSYERSRTDVTRGDVLPDLQLSGLDGSSVSLESLKGRWLLINWWSTSCVPCREEIPQLNDLVHDPENREIEFVAISPEDPERVQRFLKRYPFAYRHFVGREEPGRVFGDQFPRHLLVSPDGIVVGDFTGGSDRVGEILGQAIDQALSSRVR